MFTVDVKQQHNNNNNSIAKLHRIDIVICGHSKEGKNPSYGKINTVYIGHVRDTYFSKLEQYPDIPLATRIHV